MSMDVILTLIGSYCFPIVACCVMGWYVKYINDLHKQEVTELNTRHSEEMEKVKEALNNNTIAVEKLCLMISQKSDS